MALKKCLSAFVMMEYETGQFYQLDGLEQLFLKFNFPTDQVVKISKWWRDAVWGDLVKVEGEQYGVRMRFVLAVTFEAMEISKD